MAPVSEEGYNAEGELAHYDREEAEKAKAEQSWEEGYQACYNARENLLEALRRLQSFVAEEVGPGVVGQAHVKETFRITVRNIKASFQEVEKAWSHFAEYYQRHADTLPPEANGQSSWPPEADKPISYYPSEPVSGDKSGEEASDNESGQTN